ncbi:uncharacterized protein LOC121876935 [Homarus americanus]|uniref:uncharacterized protein LOC121876935 n=1 Tax=Homarus americanus TaxID=6706 RepID=UPI001C44B5EE|nr:uncharacterized protein LOC121876935 [Homarus americanus]
MISTPLIIHIDTPPRTKTELTRVLTMVQLRGSDCVMWMRRRTTNRNVPLGGRTIFQKVAQRRTCQACLLVLVVSLFLYCCTTLFSTQSDTEDHKGHHSINRTVIRESKQSLNVKLVQGKKTESLLEKMEYQLIKAFMGRVIASHNRRLKSSAKLNNLIDGVKASNETLKTTDITRRTKGDIQRRGDKKDAKRVKMRSGDKVNTSENETQRLTSNGRPPSLTHHPRPVTHHPRPVTHHNTSSSPMKILVYTNFFGQKKSWSDILGSRTELHGCPTANCIHQRHLRGLRG